MITSSPPSWQSHLALARGVYLLTCLRTGALYVGSASGANGFWGRWMDYEADGHGCDAALILRERADWIVSILQVVSSADTREDIAAAEALWKIKLRSVSSGCRVFIGWAGIALLDQA